MRTLLHSLAALPFLAATALAHPMQLSDQQMDKVTAGWSFAALRLPLNLIYISPIVAEDTAFQGVSVVTFENGRPPIVIFVPSFGLI